MATDVMLDLETLGTKPGCVVLSIGACTFDQEFKFYEKIDIKSSLSAGLKKDPSTEAWWMRQSPEARNEAFSGTKELVMVLGEFHDWFRMVVAKKGDTFIWGNGNDFDKPIIEAAFDAVEMKAPWKTYNGRCFRTLKNLFQEVKAPDFVGEKHNALADAIYQSIHAVAILKYWKEKRL